MKFDKYLISIQYLLNNKKTSSTRAGIIIFLGLCILYFNQLLKFEEILEKSSNIQIDILSRFLTPFHYLSIEEQIFSSPHSYIISLSIGSFIPIFNCSLLVYLLFQLEKNNDRNSFNLNLCQFVILMEDIFQWIFLYPIVQIQTSFLFKFSEIDNNLKLTQNYQSYILIILSVMNLLGLICDILLILADQIFYFNTKRKTDSFSIINNHSLYYFKLQQILQGISLNIQINLLNEHIIFVIFEITFGVLVLSQVITGKIFQIFFHQNIRKFYVMLSLFQISLTVSIIFTHISELVDVISREFSLIFMVIIQNVFISIYDQIIEAFSFKYIFQNPQNEIELMNKIFFFQEILKSSNENDRILYFGILVNHLQTVCFRDYKEFSTRCFCKQKIIFNAKKQKDITRSFHSLKKHKIFYGRLEIKSMYEKFLTENPHSINIRILYIRFLIFELNQKPAAILQIQHLLKFHEKLSFINKFRLKKLILRIQEMIQDYNSSTYNGSLDFEKTLQMESIISAIKTYIQEILNLNLKLWKHLQRGQINQQYLIEYDHLIMCNIAKCNKEWDKLINCEIRFREKVIVISYLNRKQKWQQYYKWYCIHILNKKIKHSLVESQQDEFLYEDSESDDEKFIFNKYSKEKSFSNASIVLHTDLDGNVLKQSQTCYEQTGYYSLNNISQIIPQTMARNHKIQLLIFKNHSKSNTLYRRKKIYILHQQNYIFSGNKYLKLELNHRSQLEFICLLRPINRLQQQNYLILNEEWEVDSTTFQLVNLFKSKLCLFIVCPQLLNFTKYQRYITKDDSGIFNLNFRQTQQEQENESQRVKDREKIMQEIEDICVLNSQNYFEFKDYFNKTSDQYQFTSNLQIIDEELTKIEHKSFQKIVNVEHTQILLRLPKNLDEMIEDFQQKKQEHKKDFQLKKSMMFLNSTNKMVIKNSQGQLRIVQQELMKRVYNLNDEFYQGYYKIISKSYNIVENMYIKYCFRKRNLAKIVKVDGAIRFSRRSLMDKNVVIKFNRFEVFEDNNIKSNLYNSITVKRRLSMKSFLSSPYYQLQQLNLTTQLNQISQVNQSQSQYVDDSFRINQSKTLITYDQITGDFNFGHQQLSLNLGNEENIFLKDDQNKCIKMGISEFIQFKYYSRLLALSIIITLALILIFSASDQAQNLFDDNNQQQTFFFQISFSVMKIYNAIIDLSLYNQNQIQTIIQNVWNQNSDQFYESQRNLTKEQYSLIRQTYQVDSYLESFYNLNVLQQQTNSIFDIFNQYTSNLNIFQQENFAEMTIKSDLFNQLKDVIYPNLMECLSEIVSEATEQQNYLILYQLYFRIITTIYHALVSFLIFTIDLLIINKLINKLDSMQKKIFQIERETISKICQYYNTLRYQFIHCFETKDLPLKPLHHDRYSFQHQQSDTETSKNTQIRVQIRGKKQSKIKVISVQIQLFFYLKLIFIKIFLIVSLITINAVSIIQIINLQQNQQLTNDFLNSHIFQSLTLLKYYYFGKNYDLYTDENFLDINFVVDLNSIQNKLEQEELDLEAFIDQNKYLSGNICLNQIFSSKAEDCELILNGALKRGLLEYYKLIQQMISTVLGKSEDRYDPITLQEIYQFQMFQNEIFDSAYLGVTNQNNETLQKFFDYLRIEKIIIICLFFVVAFYHFIFFEINYFQDLNIQSQKIKQFYERYIPNETLHKQKILRSELVQLGVIKR